MEVFRLDLFYTIRAKEGAGLLIQFLLGLLDSGMGSKNLIFQKMFFH